MFTSSPTSPLAMVVFASEQLWPNIHGLVHWHEHRGGISDLCIYYTADVSRSVEPAKRLASLCERLDPRIRVHLPPKPLGITPQEVRSQIVQWKEHLPGRRWIVNTTGGLKLMFAGALPCAADDDTEVVYRELSGEWFSLRMADGIATSRRLEVSIEETDAIPTKELVEVQWEAIPNAQWTSSAVVPLNVLALTRAGIALRWNWKQMFRNAGLESNASGGLLFEQYVAAAIQQMGVRNLAVNLLLRDAGGQSMHEIDLAANYGGRLLIVDCKLRTEQEEGVSVEPITSQIRQAADTQRRLGGLAAQCILIRPNRTFSDAELQLAQAHRLAVLHQPDGWRFFSALAKFLGISALPPALCEAETALAKAKQQGAASAFAYKEWTQRIPDPSPISAVIPVTADLDRCRKDLGRSWIAFELDGHFFFREELSQAWPSDRLRARLEEQFAPFGKIEVQIAESKKFYRARLVPKKDARKELLEYLKPRIDSPLLNEAPTQIRPAIVTPRPRGS